MRPTILAIRPIEDRYISFSLPDSGQGAMALDALVLDRIGQDVFFFVFVMRFDPYLEDALAAAA